MKHLNKTDVLLVSKKRKLFCEKEKTRDTFKLIFFLIIRGVFEQYQKASSCELKKSRICQP